MSGGTTFRICRTFLLNCDKTEDRGDQNWTLEMDSCYSRDQNEHINDDRIFLGNTLDWSFIQFDRFPGSGA